jgi:hypothetical protein
MQAPIDVFVSDDGWHVVTVNEHGAVGYGAYVVAFYNQKGVIRHYTLEEVLHVPQGVSTSQLNHLVPCSTTSRWWDMNSINFFDVQTHRLYFCIWVHLLDRWVAWDAATGREAVLDDAMLLRLNDKGRQWSLRQIREEKAGNAPWLFLITRKNPEDRLLIEALLTDTAFEGRPSVRNVSPPSPDGRAASHLDQYQALSAKRAWGESLLATWDHRDTSRKPPPYYLGKVEGIITLPKAPDPNHATLWIYLMPAAVGEDRRSESAPAQRLVAPFADLRFSGLDLQYAESFPFAILTVTPGQYRIKAVLDKTEPLSGARDPMYVPQPGDYEDADPPLMTVVAGEAENVLIDCTHKVADGPY